MDVSTVHFNAGGLNKTRLFVTNCAQAATATTARPSFDVHTYTRKDRVIKQHTRSLRKQRQPTTRNRNLARSWWRGSFEEKRASRKHRERWRGCRQIGNQVRRTTRDTYRQHAHRGRHRFAARRHRPPQTIRLQACHHGNTPAALIKPKTSRKDNYTPEPAHFFNGGGGRNTRRGLIGCSVKLINGGSCAQCGSHCCSSCCCCACCCFGLPPCPCCA